MNILEKADQIVNHRSEEKERMYGPFGKSMERAAAIYNAYRKVLPRKNNVITEEEEE